MSTSCEGWKEMYLINCSNDIAIIKTTSSHHHWQQAPISYYNNRNPDFQLKPSDTLFSELQIDYFQIMYNTESNIKINVDTLSVLLEPGDEMRIAREMWIFYPPKMKEQNLYFKNLTIITKSDTCIARSRTEILRLQYDKRFRYDRHYKNKVGPNTRQNRKLLIK
jgi:hypothetical protein